MPVLISLFSLFLSLLLQVRQAIFIQKNVATTACGHLVGSDRTGQFFLKEPNLHFPARFPFLYLFPTQGYDWRCFLFLSQFGKISSTLTHSFHLALNCSCGNKKLNKIKKETESKWIHFHTFSQLVSDGWSGGMEGAKSWSSSLLNGQSSFVCWIFLLPHGHF